VILGGGYQRIGRDDTYHRPGHRRQYGEVIRTVKIDGNIKRFSACRKDRLRAEQGPKPRAGHLEITDIEADENEIGRGL